MDEPTPGVVTAQVTDAGLLVRLTGEVDLCLRPELEALAGHFAGYDGQAAVDLTELTFGDATFAGFLAELLRSGRVTINAPTRLARELVLLYGLERGLRVVDSARRLPSARRSEDGSVHGPKVRMNCCSKARLPPKARSALLAPCSASHVSTASPTIANLAGSSA